MKRYLAPFTPALPMVAVIATHAFKDGDVWPDGIKVLPVLALQPVIYSFENDHDEDDDDDEPEMEDMINYEPVIMDDNSAPQLLEESDESWCREWVSFFQLHLTSDTEKIAKTVKEYEEIEEKNREATKKNNAKNKNNLN